MHRVARPRKCRETLAHSERRPNGRRCKPSDRRHPAATRVVDELIVSPRPSHLFAALPESFRTAVDEARHQIALTRRADIRTARQICKLAHYRQRRERRRRELLWRRRRFGDYNRALGRTTFAAIREHIADGGEQLAKRAVEFLKHVDSRRIVGDRVAISPPTCSCDVNRNVHARKHKHLRRASTSRARKIT